MRTSLSPTTFTLFLLALLTLAFVGPGPGSAGADDTPKKDGDPAKAPPKDGEGGGEDTDDFFEGETTFSAEQVDKAIKDGVNWLRKKMSGDGTWGNIGGSGRAYGGGEVNNPYGHPAGPTSLALYTLLKCGVPATDPGVKKGFEWLRSNHEKPRGSYETSMLLLAVCATADASKSTKASEKKLEKAKLSGPMRSWAQMLQKDLVEKRAEKGWRYNAEKVEPTGGQDLSSTQLASLALFAAHRLGVRTADSVWEDIISYTFEQQEEQGPEVVYEDPITKAKTTWHARGFAYQKGNPEPTEGQPIGSMTACGVGNLMMARFVLSAGGKNKAQWDARPDAKKLQEAVQDGLAWLDTKWSPFDNPGKPGYHIYYLYSFERMMDLIGNKLLGKHNWYSEMGQALLNRQGQDGHWETGTTHEPQDVLDTCFALLFLRRATKGAIPFPSMTGGSEDEPPKDGR